MSQNKKTPPSIDDLISKELSHDSNQIDLDEFSLDNLNLDNLDSMLDKPVNAKSTTQEITLDGVELDLDLGNKSNANSSILDELDALSQAKASETTPNPTTGGLFASHSPANDRADDDIIDLDGGFSADTTKKSDDILATLDRDIATPALSPNDNPNALSDNPNQDANDAQNNADGDKKDELPVAGIVPKPAKKSLFGGKPKTTKPSKNRRASRPSKVGKGNNADSKRLMMIVLGALVALALLIAAWFLMQDDSAETAVVAPPAISEPAPLPEPELPTDPIAPADPATSADPNAVPAATGEGLPDTSAIDAAANSLTNAPAPTETAPMTSDNTQMIDVEAITKGAIPEDPALIKEEIDRLTDKDEQFAEQAKLINEQLSLMQDLTKQKEEQIALLEAQIAQLEQEKGKQ